MHLRGSFALLLWLVLGCGMGSCALVRPPASEPEGLRLSYRVTVSSTDVRVQLEVHGRAGQRLPLQVTGSFGSARDLQLVADMAAQDGAGAPVQLASPAPHHWEVLIPSDGRLRISYRVRTDAKAHGLELSQPGFGEMPARDERHVFFLGTLVLLAPEESLTVQGPIPVAWELPPGWQPLTPFGHEAPDLSTLLNNYIAAGKFSRITREVPGGLQLEVAWFGEGELERSALPELLVRVMGTTVELMGGRAPTKRYVIMLRPDFPSGSSQGSPKRGSIQIHLPHDVPLERVHQFRSPGEPVLARILAHEYLHTWGSEPEEATESSGELESGGELRWFGEGFVHYLSHVVLLRAGLLDLDAFLSTVGREYATVEQNPWYGKASLAEASARFFDAPEARELSYSGGMVVAFLCDLELRANGQGSLERVLESLPPSSRVESLSQWLETWTKRTGSAEPVTSWVQTHAPLPFFEALKRGGAVPRETQRQVRGVTKKDYAVHATEGSTLNQLRQR